jgi:pimeloyl-ACP methyl ester carboxylesterase
LCFETVRKEIADGADHSDKLVVKYADSVENRLTRALLWLQDEVTEANWGAYLDAGKPDWSQIIVAGHGQGGAQAMMLATLHPVARVALLAAPTDADKNGPATWLATHKTPSDRIAGFCHAKDAAWPAIAAAWTALGLGGASARIDVDVIAPPHFGHHQMTTAAAATVPTDAVATDDATPLDQDVARFAHVWRGLLGK